MKIKPEPMLRLCIAAVWLANGLYCKVLDGVPRHRQIVARLFGEDAAWLIIVAIGLAEVVLAAWVWSRWRQWLCVGTQIGIVLLMNAIEFVFARDLLLWGPLNAVFAMMFCAVVFFHSYRWCSHD